VTCCMWFYVVQARGCRSALPTLALRVDAGALSALCSDDIGVFRICVAPDKIGMDLLGEYGVVLVIRVDQRKFA